MTKMLRLDEGPHRRLKIEAIRRGGSMQRIVEEWIERFTKPLPAELELKPETEQTAA